VNCLLAVTTIVFLAGLISVNAKAQSTNISEGSESSHPNVLAMQKGPTILVGHSYGGVVITEAAANASNVVGLVYISAFAPDAGEALGEHNARMPAASGQANIRPDAYGFLWIDPRAFPESFAQDVDPVQARIMAAVQKPLATSIFGENVTQAAWKTKPSWYLVSENDRIINPIWSDSWQTV
jgi:pimeloyl-ACP methyl ester carboxylesterase